MANQPLSACWRDFMTRSMARCGLMHKNRLRWSTARGDAVKKLSIQSYPFMSQVFIDGLDVQTVSIKYLRSQIGLVGQEPVMFRCVPQFSTRLLVFILLIC